MTFGLHFSLVHVFVGVFLRELLRLIFLQFLLKFPLLIHFFYVGRIIIVARQLVLVSRWKIHFSISTKVYVIFYKNLPSRLPANRPMCLFMLLSSSTSLRRSISKHSTISFLLSTISTNLQKNRERVCITDIFRCQFFNNYTNNQSIISRYLCINASSLCLSKSVLVASGWHMRHRI